MGKLQEYSAVLGVSENASLLEIKMAYRRLARKHHPDVSKEPDAHERFVAIVQAYEYLTAYKSGEIRLETEEPENSYEQWREEARERAQAYARMRYEEYVNSKDYKVVSALEIIESFGLLLFAIGIVIVLPIALLYFFGWQGFWIAVVLNVVMSPATALITRHTFKLKLSTLWQAIHFLSGVRATRFAFIMLANIIILLKIGLQTLIPFYWLLILIAIAIAFMFIRSVKKGYDTYKRTYYAFVLGPGIVSIMLLLNFFVSFNKTVEHYGFSPKMQYVSGRHGSPGGWQESTLIILEDNKYSEYFGIRVFLYYESVRYHRHIAYTFRDGILGFRVLSTYEFYD